MHEFKILDNLVLYINLSKESNSLEEFQMRNLGNLARLLYIFIIIFELS